MRGEDYEGLKGWHKGLFTGFLLLYFYLSKLKGKGLGVERIQGARG